MVIDTVNDNKAPQLLYVDQAKQVNLVKQVNHIKQVIQFFHQYYMDRHGFIIVTKRAAEEHKHDAIFSHSVHIQ